MNEESILFYKVQMYSYTKRRCFDCAIVVQSIPNFGISVWAYNCSRTANPLASINSKECTALQLLTLAWFLNFILYTKYEFTVVQNTCVLIVQWFNSENSLGSVDS